MTYIMRWVIDELEKAEKQYTEDKKDADNGHLDCEQVAAAEARMKTLKDVREIVDKYITIKRKDFARNQKRIETAVNKGRIGNKYLSFIIDVKRLFFDIGDSRMRRISAKIKGTWKGKDKS